MNREKDRLITEIKEGESEGDRERNKHMAGIGAVSGYGKCKLSKVGDIFLTGCFLYMCVLERSEASLYCIPMDNL